MPINPQAMLDYLEHRYPRKNGYSAYVWRDSDGKREVLQDGNVIYDFTLLDQRATGRKDIMEFLPLSRVRR